MEQKIDIPKLVRICKSLSKEERKELFYLLKDEVAPTMITIENRTQKHFPAERTEIQYQGKLINR